MKNKKYKIIYKIINQLNNKEYIGKHETDNINDSYFGSGLILKSAIKMYGKNNFKKEIIEYCESVEELNVREIYWIEKLNSFSPNGYNINSGGKGGDNFTHHPNKEEIRIKMVNRKPRKHTDEEKEIRRIRMTGKKLKPHNKIECKHCNKSISQANHNRWHGDNCKLAQNYEKKEQPKILCVHCDNEFNVPNYYQSHGKYCKLNINREHKKPRKTNSKESYIKASITKKLNGTNIQSEESNKKRSEKLKGRIIDEEHKKLLSESGKLKWKKIKEKNILYKCEHCNLETINKTNYIRWHGDNCKKKHNEN